MAVAASEEVAGDARLSARRLRICLAGSGGGHVRQLLDLECAWLPHDYFFVTEDSALGRSLAKDHETHFVSHVALGQARLGAPLRMIVAGIANVVRSAGIMFRKRPDVVLTTGAGAMFATLLWARLLGARIVLIETFARFDRPSMFTRIAAPFAHHRIVQSAAVAAYVPGAEVFDPLRPLEVPQRAKASLLFATVGATLPFDRLVRDVAALKAAGEIPERVVIQTGIGGYRPDGIETHETLSFDAMQACLQEASIVVCHGGTGSLVTALRQGCRVVVMPRVFERGEHYDNHQSEITSAFSARGLVVPATSREELSAALKTARARPPVAATTDMSALVARLNVLFGLFQAKKAGAAR
jgi:UDP-N-acetylglucosamine--N-acetylmuramyl-(pentapeptide) pyrophosphoryl-undecaprenol N-acetylglucosamine transferase